MTRTHPLLRTAGALTATGLLGLVATAGPAGAVDDTKPSACNGMAFVDPAGDNVSTAVPSTTPTTDLTGGFVKHDPAKGDQATTFNIVVKDLKVAVPGGYTTMAWTGYYPGPDNTRWVRLVADFSGGQTYEFGHLENEDVNAVSIYEGDTPGKAFEGPDGVIQIVIPKDHVKNGDTLKPVYAVMGQGQASLPPQTGAPVRGTTWAMDRAPDDEGDANKSAVVAPCPAPGAGPTVPDPMGPVAGPNPPGSTNPPPTPPKQTSNQPATGSGQLPVKLLTKSVKAKQAKSAMKLKLKSTEKLTALSAQLRKGSKLVGKGKLASLNGTATLKLKVKKPKKGTYVLDLAGRDASGRQRLASFLLKVK